jgi:putative ATP-binding cassette transporter
MMTDRPEESAGATPETEAEHSGLVPQLTMMFRALWTSPVRNTLIAFWSAIVFVVAATAYGQIRLNRWNQPFYDALSHRDFSDFLRQLAIFGLIAGTLLVLNVAQRWLVEMLKLKLRDGLVRDLIDNWLRPGRAFRLASAGAIGVNPDQRMHEDARHLTELSGDLAVGLLQSSMLLVMFVNVLWRLSSGFTLNWHGRGLMLPGYMVWAAVLYAGSASLLSYWVGRNLIARNAQRYAREADLRFSLVRVNEHIDAVALAAGETDEARRIHNDLAAVLTAMRRLVNGLTNLTWVTAGYGWFTLVAPILVAVPLYFAGYLSFGGLMMAAGAFTQVQSSLRWFVDNFSVIADWRATLLRVADFRLAVLSTDTLHETSSRIAYEEGQPDRFQLDHLEIASPTGCTMIEEPSAEVKNGERVLIVGEAGAGKTLLFRALAGLWPWGAGRITRPKDAEILYMPRIAYMPPGTLREVMAYPRKVDSFRDQAFGDALYRLGLRRLVPLLDESRRWDRELNEDQQQMLAFARVMVHAPPWVIVDGLLDPLDEETRHRIMTLFTQELRQTGVIHIGRTAVRNEVFSRMLHLVNDPTIRRLARHRPSPPVGTVSRKKPRGR